MAVVKAKVKNAFTELITSPSMLLGQSTRTTMNQGGLGFERSDDAWDVMQKVKQRRKKKAVPGITPAEDKARIARNQAAQAERLKNKPAVVAEEKPKPKTVLKKLDSYKGV